MRFTFLLVFLCSTVAYADVIDPSEFACDSASEGDECSDEQGLTGTCEQSECCRLDYSGGGGEPETVCEACLRCTPSEAPAGGSAGEAPAGGSAGEAPAGGSAGEAAPSSSDDSGCISSASTPLNLGLLSVFVGVMFSVRLRRTRK